MSFWEQKGALPWNQDGTMQSWERMSSHFIHQHSMALSRGPDIKWLQQYLCFSTSDSWKALWGRQSKASGASADVGTKSSSTRISTRTNSFAKHRGRKCQDRCQREWLAGAKRIVFVSNKRYSQKTPRNNWLLEILTLENRKEPEGNIYYYCKRFLSSRG